MTDKHDFKAALEALHEIECNGMFFIGADDSYKETIQTALQMAIDKECEDENN